MSIPDTRDTAVYPGFDVYKLIVDWIEKAHRDGKVLDPDLRSDDARLITRGDIGSLNTSIRALIADRNEHLRFR